MPDLAADAAGSVVIMGVEYVTLTVAAARLGATPQAVNNRLKKDVRAPQPAPHVTGAKVYSWAQFEKWWKSIPHERWEK